MVYVLSWTMGLPKIFSARDSVHCKKMHCIPLNLVLWGGYKLTF